jgi:hypothetical protein
MAKQAKQEDKQKLIPDIQFHTDGSPVFESCLIEEKSQRIEKRPTDSE